MKQKNVSFMKKIFVLPLVLGWVCCGPVLAASNGCDEDDNDAVVAELALCSTHAYNIGSLSNPKDPSEKQLMADVIAMKTTVITQQLYRQYEQMESMMARFKTQLEKAVLKNKLGAAGAKIDDEDAGSYRSNDGYTILSGTSNCRQQVANGQTHAISCLKNNLNYIINAANAGNTTDARKQLIQDLSAAKTILGNKINVSDGSYGDGYYLDCTIGSDKKEVSGSSCDVVCKDILEGSKKKSSDVANCAYTVLGIINTAENDIRRAEMRLSQPSYRY